jgi:hypothetical protein
MLKNWNQPHFLTGFCWAFFMSDICLDSILWNCQMLLNCKIPVSNLDWATGYSDKSLCSPWCCWVHGIKFNIDCYCFPPNPYLLINDYLCISFSTLWLLYGVLLRYWPLSIRWEAGWTQELVQIWLWRENSCICQEFNPGH